MKRKEEEIIDKRNREEKSEVGTIWSEYKKPSRNKKYLSGKDLDYIDMIWIELNKVKKGEEVSSELKEKLIEGLYNPLLSKELWGRSIKVTLYKIREEWNNYNKREEKKRRSLNIKGLKKKQSLGNKRKDLIFKRNRQRFISHFKKWKMKNLTILEDYLNKLGEISGNDWESWNKKSGQTYLETYWLKEDKLMREYKYVVNHIWKENYKWSLLKFKRRKIK